MNKAQIIEDIADQHGLTKTDAGRVVDHIFDSVVSTVSRGEEVSIAGLGIFSAKTRPARTGRNPRTGESVQIPERQVPKFRPAKAFKDSVNQ